MTYDPTNIFARILRGEIPTTRLYEDEHALAFPDINPQAPTHILVIPKGAYISIDDFARHAPPATQAGFWHAVVKVASEAGVDASGYRLLTNHGPDSHQEVPHFHVHIMGGRKLGPLVAKQG